MFVTVGRFLPDREPTAPDISLRLLPASSTIPDLIDAVRAEVVGNDARAWPTARDAAHGAIAQRIRLWDGVRARLDAASSASVT